MLEQFYTPVVDTFFSIISALAIFLIALIVGKFAGLIVTNLIYELKIEEILETVGFKFFISKVAGMAVSLAIYITGIVIALNQLGITRIVVIVLAVFFAVIIALAIFLGVADIIRNFFLGLFLRKRYLGKRMVNIEPVKGKVVEVGFTRIKVLTKEKDLLVVPFSALD